MPTEKKENGPIIVGGEYKPSVMQGGMPSGNAAAVGQNNVVLDAVRQLVAQQEAQKAQQSYASQNGQGTAPWQYMQSVAPSVMRASQRPQDDLNVGNIGGAGLNPQIPIQQAPSNVPYEENYLDVLDRDMNDAKQRYEAARQADAAYRRSEMAKKWVTGIGDTLAAAATLFGTGAYGEPVATGQMTKAANEQADYEQQRRNNIIRSLENDLKDRKRAILNYRTADLNARSRETVAQMNAEARASTEASKDARQDKSLEVKREQMAQNAKLAADRINSQERIAKIRTYGKSSGTRGSGTKTTWVRAAAPHYSEFLDEMAVNLGFDNWDALGKQAATERWNSDIRKVYDEYDVNGGSTGKKKTMGQMEAILAADAKDSAENFYNAYSYGQQEAAPTKKTVEGFGSGSKKKTVAGF